MAFDSAIASFTTKTNKVDLVDAAHINAVQAELVTIETILGIGVKGDRSDLKTRLNNALDADGSILSGTSFPSPGLASQMFWRTDINTLYINTAPNTWASQASNPYASGSYLLASLDTNRTFTGSLSYRECKSFIVPRAGTLTVTFDLAYASGPSANAYGRIYRNGVAVGTERIQSSGAGVYTTYSENIAGWSTGDLCQLFVKMDTSTSSVGEVMNFRIKSSVPTIETSVTDTSLT